MGINMNYKKIYDALIARGKIRILEGYYEKHHIVPKCIGGSDHHDNIVSLTPEEHYLAHQLLIKIYPNNHKLVYAASMMTIHNSNCRTNNKMYGWLRRKRNEIISAHMRNDWIINREKRIKASLDVASRADIKLKKSLHKKKWWEENLEAKKQLADMSKDASDKARIVNKELWQTEEYRAKMEKRTRGNNSNTMKEKWADPNFRNKMIESRRVKRETE